MAFDVRRFDIYRKIPKDLTQPTTTGAIISICCCIFMTVLFFSELFSYIYIDVVSDLFVDNPGKSEKIPVRINITLPRLSCDAVGLDIQDDMGRHEVGFVEDTNKIKINEDKGCIFEAKFKINKVPGNFHVSTHAAAKQPESIDMSHEIHHVIFGEELHEERKKLGSFNPLGKHNKLDAKDVESHDYFMRIVPTIYEDLSGHKTQTYQATYAYRKYVSFGATGRIIPAIWFRYDLNPITVRYVEKRQPFYSFLTKICAIVGGTFTVAGIIDSTIFTAAEIFKKAEIGKLS